MSHERQAGQADSGSSHLVATAVLTGLSADRISIVVPTRNESANVAALVDRLERVVSTDSEIIFVDDSDDNTPDIIAALARPRPGRVRLLHRQPGHRSGGLGGAVVAGIEIARFPWVVVMDGDLQHPPEFVPALMEAARAERADAVVASRYRRSGSADGLAGRLRRHVSGMSGRLARLAFPRRVGRLTDPMSGFFAVRRDILHDVDLRPHGYKILLEILVRARITRVAEVAYVFAPRRAGESKASLREGLRFLRHLAGLRCAALIRPRSPLARMIGFAIAGGSGIAVNTVALWLLSGVLGVPSLLAQVGSTEIAIVWNFVIVDRLVMPQTDRRPFGRFARFFVLNNALVPVGLLLYWGLIIAGRMNYLAANLLAIVAVFLIRYVVVSRWIYGARSVLPALIRRAGKGVWYAGQTRLALAFLLTLVATPGLAALAWNGLWSNGPNTPLVIPLAAAAALAAGRLRPATGEPDVHDRQVDILVAGVLLVAAIVLTRIAPHDRPSLSYLLAVGVAFLAAATILLLGTRTATRLRWALLLPVVAAVPVTSAPLGRAGIRLADAGAALSGVPPSGRLASVSLTVQHGGQVLVLATGPGTALVGTLMCLTVAGLYCFGPRPAQLIRLAAAGIVAAAVAVLTVAATVLAGRYLGPEAFRIAQLPAVADLALATTAAVVVRHWSRQVGARQPVKRHYVPRTRLAVVALLVVAVALGVPALPRLAMVAPRPTVASNIAPVPH